MSEWLLVAAASTLRQIESIEPRLQTGHIVTAAVGNVVRTDADFLSLNCARATPSLVRQAHAAGKGVHVGMQERRALSHPEQLGLLLRVLFDKPPRELTDPAAVMPL